jgi:hypothetical protein
MADEMPARQALALMLFSIAARVAELGEDLKSVPRGAHRAEALRGQFAELRQAVADGNTWIAVSAAARFSDELTDIAAVAPALAAKSSDLDQQLDRFVERCREAAN